MAEFYNVETLLDFVKQNTPHIDGETTKKCVERAIKEAPTADVVEVVRCGKCKYHKTHTCAITGIEILFCDYGNTVVEVEPTHFCSYGERKLTKIEHNSLCETETHESR